MFSISQIYQTNKMEGIGAKGSYICFCYIADILPSSHTHIFGPSFRQACSVVQFYLRLLVLLYFFFVYKFFPEVMKASSANSLSLGTEWSENIARYLYLYKCFLFIFQ